jgi:hypothetical protein
MSTSSSTPDNTAHTTTVSNSANSWRMWRALRGSKIETNTCVSGMMFFVFMGVPKRQKTTQFMPV